MGRIAASTGLYFNHLARHTNTCVYSFWQFHLDFACFESSSLCLCLKGWNVNYVWWQVSRPGSKKMFVLRDVVVLVSERPGVFNTKNVCTSCHRKVQWKMSYSVPVSNSHVPNQEKNVNTLLSFSNVPGWVVLG